MERTDAVNLREWYDRLVYDRQIKRELREFLRGESDELTARLISPTAEYVPSTDTAHYSVRRWDAALNRWVYAPWDWGRAKEVFACNVMKVSQGFAPDPFYDEHSATMRSAAVPYGSYCFFDSQKNAITQAQTFCNKAEASGGYGFVVAIDCEPISGVTTAPPRDYIDALGSLIYEIDRRKPENVEIIIYSRASFWDQIWVAAGSPAWTTALPQWQAQYPTALQTEAAQRAILYDGWVPTFPANLMRGLGPRWGWQWSGSLRSSLIPGHPGYKLAEDGDLWKRSTIPSFPTTPPLTDKEKLDRLWDLHSPTLH